MNEWKPEDDNIYVCRCEEVTVGDIKRAIAAGADSLKAIKMRTHAGMGVCQGMTCRKKNAAGAENRSGSLPRPFPAFSCTSFEYWRYGRRTGRGGKGGSA